MAVYRFTLQFVGDVESSLDALYEAGWGDGMVAGDQTGGYADFFREADNAIDAITSAIEQGEACGLEITGVTEDLVTLDEIAERVGYTLAAVDNWVRGRRGPGGFPAPRVPRPRAALFSWAEVAGWLARHGISEIDNSDVEIAQACSLLDDILRARARLRALPRKSRERITRLVA